MSFQELKINDKVDHGDMLMSTEAEEETFSIDYEIKKFPNFDKTIISPVFVGGPKSQHEWKLQVYPKSKKDDNDDTEYVGIYLNLVKNSGDPKSSLFTKFQFCLMNSERKILRTKTSDLRNFMLGVTSSWGWNTFIPKSDALNLNNGYLTDGHTLKIHCKISVTLGSKSSSFPNINSNLNLQTAFESVSEKMSSFLDAGTFADFTIKTNTSSFPVCKVLLAAQSDVLNSMFQSGMRESRENIIKIEDHSDDAVRGMLKFLYTGQIDLTEKDAGDLLAIADKYQVLDMKYKCEEFLLKNLKIENAADTLIMAHFHSPSLKPKVMYFINRYKQEVKLTNGFNQMKNTHPIIFADLYNSIN